MAYIIYRENEFVVAQCLNADISSFGSTHEQAIANLKEALELYYQSDSVCIPATVLTPKDFGF
jgi:predicted RNase H-like HicB family nuclease